MSAAREVRMPGEWDRRNFLCYSGPGLLSAALGHGQSGRAGVEKPGRAAARADACIIVLLTGGPSHLDVWDLKPNAPAEVRGPFCSIATRVPGLRLCEHLPKLAQQAHRFALVRSVHHKTGGRHSAAAYVALTGVEADDVARPASRSDYPAFGSVIAMKREPGRFPLPYVWLPFRTTEVELGARPISGMLAGFLGSRFDPFFVVGDLTDPEFSVPGLAPQAAVGEERLRERLQLLGALDQRKHAAAGPEWREVQERASDLVTSDRVRQAFALDDEPESLRDSYGQDQFGAGLLLARRLVERGSRVVCVSMDSSLNSTWDTHFDNFNTLRGKLLPKLDAGLPALLADLAERGMLKRTLVLAFGEFGREPKISKSDGQGPGRSHWPHCYTVLLAGGGIKGGAVFGSSDKLGAYPDTDPVSPADILATAYQCAGLPPGRDSELVDPLGRPVNAAPDGKSIERLIG